MRFETIWMDRWMDGWLEWNEWMNAGNASMAWNGVDFVCDCVVTLVRSSRETSGCKWHIHADGLIQRPVYCKLCSGQDIIWHRISHWDECGRDKYQKSLICKFMMWMIAKSGAWLIRKHICTAIVQHIVSMYLTMTCCWCVDKQNWIFSSLVWINNVENFV